MHSMPHITDMTLICSSCVVGRTSRSHLSLSDAPLWKLRPATSVTEPSLGYSILAWLPSLNMQYPNTCAIKHVDISATNSSNAALGKVRKLRCAPSVRRCRCSSLPTPGARGSCNRQAAAVHRQCGPGCSNLSRAATPACRPAASYQSLEYVVGCVTFAAVQKAQGLRPHTHLALCICKRAAGYSRPDHDQIPNLRMPASHFNSAA